MKIMTLISYMVLIIVLTSLSYAITIFINKEFVIFQQSYSNTKVNLDNNLQNKNNGTLKDRLLRQDLYGNVYDKLLKCQLSKSWEDCCGIFLNTGLMSIVKQCTVNDILDILQSETEIGGSIRRKRENMLLNHMPYDSNDYLLNSNKVFNYFDYNLDYNEYDTEDQYSLYSSLHTNNLNAPSKFSSYEDQYNLGYIKKEATTKRTFHTRVFTAGQQNDNSRYSLTTEGKDIEGTIFPNSQVTHSNSNDVLNFHGNLDSSNVSSENSSNHCKQLKQFETSNKCLEVGTVQTIDNKHNSTLETFEIEDHSMQSQGSLDISSSQKIKAVTTPRYNFYNSIFIDEIKNITTEKPVYINLANNSNKLFNASFTSAEENISSILTASHIITTAIPEEITNKTLQKSKAKSSRTNGEINFSPKVKADTFPMANEDVQINQQSSVNPCFYPYPPPLGPPYSLAASFDDRQLLKIVPMNTPKIPQYNLNPPVYPYMQPAFMQPPFYLPTYISSNQQLHQKPYGYNTPVQVSSPVGQYYMCNPIPAPTNHIAAMPGIEIRRQASNLQDLMETIPMHLKSSNKTRQAIITCPNGQECCADGSRCVRKQHICDNEVNCDDGSDEMFCSCKDRVGKIRRCDGFFDCPNGEDENECFGCAEDEFSCDDWSKFRRSSTCIPMQQRCDNIRQCEITGKDEEDCLVLTDSVGNQSQFKISNSVGFLHRNYKGRWYPSCFGSEIWAEEVCKIESGPSHINPKVHMMLMTDAYNGKFVNNLDNADVGLVKSCVQDRTTFVECPPLYCGLRMVTKNPFRQHEVETSVEDFINELERLSHESRLLNETLTNNINAADNGTGVLGVSRVVGGTPTQPAAWPWLVSIYRNGIFHCGGVLINEKWVVTAAHCVNRYWLYYYNIQAGMLRRFSYSPMEQHRWAVRVIPHGNYDQGSLRNDIALIELSSPVRYNRYIRPICLPSEATAGRDFVLKPSAGEICTTVGWGATIEHGSDPDHMREVEIPVLDHCKNKEDQVGDAICAGLFEGGRDACQGDSGGPFMCRNANNPSQWYLAGIVSHGEGCARPNEPGVYTRVSKFVGWIAESIKHEKIGRKIPLQKCPGYICEGINKCLPKKRRCDKIVDCLLGDDERNCKHIFHDMLRHSRKPYFVGSPFQDKDEYGVHFVTSILDDIISDLRFTDNKSTDTTNKSTNTTTANTSRLNLQDANQSQIIVNKETSTDSSAVTQSINAPETSHYFKCKRMLQIIHIHKKCNKIVDCEDGTDELDCLCADYMRNYNLKSICDGITDCYDISDETDCSHCKSSEYYCRQSHVCIDKTKQCDGVAHCLKSEDEQDCAALTNGVTLTLDSDLRPKLAMSGIITINRFGVWRPFCVNMTDNEASIATNVCNLLGFEEYIGYHKYQVKDKPLNVTIEGFKPFNYTDEPSDMCSGLYVRCSNVSLGNFVHNVYQENKTSDVELYSLPWTALIYSDGIYRCMGTIIDTYWIITSLNCFKGITTLHTNYVVVLLGKGKFQHQVNGPHEQIIRVIQSSVIEESDVTLLRLEQRINFSRYVRPANMYTRRDILRNEKCVTVGMEESRAKYVFLRPSQNCRSGFRCFESKISEDCKISFPWSGTIACDSGNGWYPAAVYNEDTGYCGLSSTKQYTSITFLRSSILNAMKQQPIEVDLPQCDGFRCKLGECITKDKVCNGITDCGTAEDEDSQLRYEKEIYCHRADNCACPIDHFKCSNNKCVPKSSFCDKVNDCGDYGDEPDICSCKEYLFLTNSTKICDGIVHCMDRTDEDPKLCPCKQHSVKCGNTPYCVSNDMICDGYRDCPSGEDEAECLTLRAKDNKRSNAGEVLRRTSGIWHSGCFKLNYTIPELEEICHKLGYTGGSVSQLISPTNASSLTALRPEIDGFNIIWIHRTPGNKLQLRIRTGNQPYVTFSPDHGCYKLFIACFNM